MKRLLLLTAIFLAAATGMSLRAENLPLAKPTSSPDTIQIKLPNGAGITLYVKNSDQLKTLKKYKLDSLIVMLDKYIDQIEKMDKATINEGSNEVTVTFHPSKDLKDPNAPEEVNITVTKESKSSDYKNSGVTLSGKSLEDAIKVYVEYRKKNRENLDSIKIVKREEKASRRIVKKFYVDLGLNAFMNTPNEGNLYDLKPLGSRYVSLNRHYQIRVGSPASAFFFQPGIEVSFNNYMFDKNHYAVDNSGITTFKNDAIVAYEKSKLATSAINIPLNFYLKFKDKHGKKAFTIGAGGFGGYRLGSHTKLKYQSEGKTEKDKDRGSYNLEDFQYGVNFAIGFRNLELFTKYNLNDLFKDNRGPKMNVISFGFRI